MHLLTAHLRGREERAALSWDDTDLAEFLLPEAGVELAVHSLDLPGALLATLVGGLQDVDALDGGEALSEGCSPAESDGVAGDGLNGEDGEANGRLATLASLEGGLAGEGGAAEGIWSKSVFAFHVT